MALFNLSDPFIKALKAVNQISAGQTTLTQEDLRRQRSSMELAARLAAPALGVSTENLTIEDIPAQWIRPDYIHNTSCVILYCHGGGYTCGGLGYARILAAKLALHTGLEVLSFAYRLAPEHPYPAAFSDAMTVWDYLMHQGYGASQVLLAGDSAGGNLALLIAQQLQDQKRKQPRALLLFSPWTDMTATSESYQTHREDDPILTYDYVISVRSAYAGEDADFSNPVYSPLFGSFQDFPPTLIQAGEFEILQEDSNKLARKLKKETGRVSLEIYDGGWHVFQQMPVPLAARAMKDAGAFVQRLLYE